MILSRHPTDLTDTEWALLAPLVPAAKAGGRSRTTDMREVVNAVFYSCVAVANGACCRKNFRLIRRSTTSFEAGGCWGRGNGYTRRLLVEMCGKPTVAIRSRALELSIASALSP